MLRVLGLSFSLVVLLGACISYSGGEPDRDRVTYESFEARQEKVVLQEPGQDGEAIHIAYSRRGGSGGGNAVVLLHGVPSSSWRYRYVLEDLQDDDLVVIAPDLLGYGSSSKPQTPVARELAARRPDLFGGLVVLDTAVQREGYYQPFRDRLADYQSIISSLELPSAVIWGAQDENLLATPSAERFTSALGTPPSRSRRFRDAKHLIAEEEPALIAEAIRHVAGR